MMAQGVRKEVRVENLTCASCTFLKRIPRHFTARPWTSFDWSSSCLSTAAQIRRSYFTRTQRVTRHKPFQRPQGESIPWLPSAAYHGDIDLDVLLKLRAQVICSHISFILQHKSSPRPS